MKGIGEELFKVGKGSGAYILGNIFVRSFGFITMPIMTRFMTPDLYGQVSLCFLVSSFIEPVLRLGQFDAYQKYYHEYKDRDWQVFFSTSLSLLSSSALMVLAVLLLFGQPILKLIAPGVPIFPYILIAVLSSLLLLYFDIACRILQVREKSITYTKAFVLKTVIRVLLLVSLLLLLNDKLLAAVLAILIAALFGLLIFIYLMRGYFVFSFNLRMLSQQLRFGIPLMPNDLALLIMLKAGLVFVANYVDAHAVGLYAVANAVVGAVFMVNLGANDAWTPFFFRYASNKSTETKTVLSRMTTYYLAAVWPLNFLVAVFGLDIMYIVAGKQYSGAAVVVAPLILAAMLGALQYRFINPILFSKKPEYVATSTIIVAAVNISLNFLLVPKFGILGAAWSIVISRLLYVTIFYNIAQRLFRIEYEWKRILLVFAALFCGYLLSLFIQLHTSHLTALALKSLVVLLIPVLLIKFGFLTNEEKMSARRMLHSLARKYLHSVKGD